MQVSMVWSETFKIHSYEVDARRRLTLEAACRYFQEAAWNHAEALGAGYSHLAQQNKLWVLARLAIQIEHYPTWGERLRIDTWPRAAQSAFALRDFEMLDDSGKRLLAGTSSWLVLDRVSRKPQRIDKLLAGIEPLPERRALGAEPEKLAPLDPAHRRLEAMNFKVRWSDLDVNGHVNYSRYISWVIDAHSESFHRAHEVSALQMNYLGETGMGEALTVESAESSPGEHRHSLLNAAGKEVCRARTCWKRLAG